MARDPHLPLTPADIAWARAAGKPLAEDDGGDIKAICERDWDARMARIGNRMPARGWMNIGGTATARHQQQYLLSVETTIGKDRLETMREQVGEDAISALGMPYFENDVDYLKDLAERIFFGIPLDAGDNDRLREIAHEGKLAKRPLED